MERKSKLREAIEQVKSDVKGITEEAKETVEELKETTRGVVPHPIRNRIQKRVDTVLSGRGRRRGRHS